MLAICIAGCAGAPGLPLSTSHGGANGKSEALTVTDVVDEIVCEIGASPGLASDPKPPNRQWIATAILTIQIDDTIGLTPSLNFIQPYATAATSYMTTVSGEYSGQRQRTFTTTFTIDVGKLQAYYVKYKDQGLCSEPRHGRVRLEGNLKIAEIVNSGVNLTRSTLTDEKGAPFDNKDFIVGTLQLDPDVDPGAKLLPSFGSTIQFIIKHSLSSLGPLWTLKRFKGPSGSSGLVNAGYTDTDKLIITFAPVYPKGAQSPACLELRNRMARDIVRRMSEDPELRQQFHIEGRATSAAEQSKILSDQPFQDSALAACNASQKKGAETSARSLLNIMVLQNALPTVPAQ
jgi:hypothetical protein